MTEIIEKRIPIIWLIDNITQEQISKTIQKSFGVIPFKAYFITIIRTDDIYVKNYFDTLFYMAVKKSFVLHVPKHTSLEDCLAVAENFVEKCAPYYIFIRDCVLIDKDLFLKVAKQFFDDKKNNIYALKETTEDGKTVVFDPTSDPVGRASYLLSKVRLSKIYNLGRVDLGAISSESVITLNTETEDFVDPRKLNYEKTY